MKASHYNKLRWDDGVTVCYSGEIKDRIKSLNNEVYFNSNVTGESINALLDELTKVIEKQHAASTSHLLPADAPAIGVTLYLDSPGGVIKDAFKFIDFVCALKRTQKLHLTTVCFGTVASAATLMSLIGDVRYITPNAVFMVHELWSECWGTYTHLASRMKHIDALHERIVRFYLTRVPSIARDHLEEMLKSETWFSAEECAVLGFAEILQ